MLYIGYQTYIQIKLLYFVWLIHSAGSLKERERERERERGREREWKAMIETTPNLKIFEV